MRTSVRHARRYRVKNVSLISLLTALLFCLFSACHPSPVDRVAFRVGAAATAITPFGQNADWEGPITASGVWGEKFTDVNKNDRWDAGEPFIDDDGDTRLDSHSQGKYDGIYLAGFGHNRIATGKHDDLWARALVLDTGSTRFAIVSLDLIGYYSQAGYYGAEQVRKLLGPELHIQDVLITSTHNHEGPDTIGLWGADQVSDGKFPLYLCFVDREIAKAITQAAQSLMKVRMRLGTTTPRLSLSLTGLQTRTGGRPPQFFDDELRVMQFVGTEGRLKEQIVATLINWNTHPESMESENTILTSDFPGAVREKIEEKYGGVAIYVSGDLGAVEIVGDNEPGSRTEFDGKTFPALRGDKSASFTFERTEAIGHDIAKAASDAIEGAEWSRTDQVELKKAEMAVPLDNQGYQFLSSRGVLPTLRGMDKSAHPRVFSTVFALQLGDAQIITVPGELFPEVFYGVEKYRRRDCPAADTHGAPEPAVRNFMTAKYRFVFGLCPDELGYFVPRYDFRAPKFDPKQGLTEARDACNASGVPAHYHETNSASSRLAPVWACAASRLLGKNLQPTSQCETNDQALDK